ncbi:MAG: LPS assembly lipoprotein LptE [Bacteroidetes bacterium]|nr:LPS assembly lipoprotein LptE [Bacteroidota bacterium]
MKRKYKITLYLLPLAIAGLLLFTQSSCGIYKFNETGSIPDSIKTVKVNFIENRAQYINPQLSPRLTDKLRQKIVGQTKLTQTNNDNADWLISGYVQEYSFMTSAISGQQGANSRLTVAIHITLEDRKEGKTTEHDVSRSFEFKGNKTFQQAESELADEMVRTMTDDIFNKLFSNW